MPFQATPNNEVDPSWVVTENAGAGVSEPAEFLRTVSPVTFVVGENTLAPCTVSSSARRMKLRSDEPVPPLPTGSTPMSFDALIPAILESVTALLRIFAVVMVESAIAGLGNDPVRSPPAVPVSGTLRRAEPSRAGNAPINFDALIPAILASVIALSRTLPEVTAESAIRGLGNDPAKSPPAEPPGVEVSAVRAIV